MAQLAQRHGDVLQLADLTDQGILVELKLPLRSKRLDVLITGSNPDTRRDSAVDRRAQAVDRGRPLEHHRLRHGRLRRQAPRHLHPSRQVEQYQRYLLDTHPAFSDDPAIALDACAYLHYAQHDPKSPLYHADFATLLGTNPSFAGDQSDAPRDVPRQRVAGPDEGEILDRVAATAFKPHKRLLDHVARVIRNEPTFVLLDEQLVAYNAILDAVGDAGRTSRTSSSSSKAARAPASRSSPSTSSRSSPSAASARST